MIYDEDPLRRRPRESTARRLRHERCVWMARETTKWPSTRWPITKNHVIGWLQWEQSSLGDGAVVRFPRIWMSSGECRIKVPDEPGSPTHSRHTGHALRGQSACPRPQYPTLRGNRTIKNEAKEKPRVGNIRFYPPATRRQANILHRTAKTCTSTPSANNFLPPRQLLTIAL